MTTMATTNNNNSNSVADDRRRHTALFQIILVSVVCFCGPGSFNALSSIASGVANPAVAYNGNAVIYATFATSGLVSAGVANVWGVRASLFAGASGYPVYAGCLLWMGGRERGDGVDGVATYDRFTTSVFYGGCAVLGACAGLLWTAQGQVVMAYPTADTKGRYLSVFWTIFNAGATLGGLLAFLANLKVGEDGGAPSVSVATHAVFLAVMAAGAVAALGASEPHRVVRPDGTRVRVPAPPDARTEIAGLARVAADARTMLLLPLFAYSNWFYAYHSFYNVALFNARSGGLASALYWGSQTVGAVAVGRALDSGGGGGVSRRQRAFVSLGAFAASACVMWGWGLSVQRTYDLRYRHRYELDVVADFPRYAYLVSLYAFYGFNDSIAQVWAYWLMGQLSDDVRVLGRYAGYFKAVQSATAAISWRLGGSEVDPSTQLAINWALAGAAVAGAAECVRRYLRDEDDDHEGDSPSSASSLSTGEGVLLVVGDGDGDDDEGTGVV